MVCVFRRGGSHLGTVVIGCCRALSRPSCLKVEFVVSRGSMADLSVSGIVLELDTHP